MSSSKTSGLFGEKKKKTLSPIHIQTIAIAKGLITDLSLHSIFTNVKHNAIVRQNVIRVYEFLVAINPSRIVGKNKPKKGELLAMFKRDVEKEEEDIKKEKLKSQERESAEVNSNKTNTNTQTNKE